MKILKNLVNFPSFLLVITKFETTIYLHCISSNKRRLCFSNSKFYVLKGWCLITVNLKKKVMFMMSKFPLFCELLDVHCALIHLSNKLIADRYVRCRNVFQRKILLPASLRKHLWSIAGLCMNDLPQISKWCTSNSVMITFNEIEAQECCRRRALLHICLLMFWTTMMELVLK